MTSRRNWKSVSSRKRRSCLKFSFIPSRGRIIEGRFQRWTAKKKSRQLAIRNRKSQDLNRSSQITERGIMLEANASWTHGRQFVGEATSGHALAMDGDKKSAASPIEMVLIGLCGCTGYAVVAILHKKREPFTRV